MMRHKKLVCLGVFAALALLIIAGCGDSGSQMPADTAKPQEKIAESAPVDISLKLKEADTTVYRLKTESLQSVKWEGDIPEKATFKGGQNKTNLDMTFSQFVEGIDKDDVTYVKITIKSLKFTSVVRDNPTIDFDSSRLADQNSVLAKLIGKSYNITVGPRGGAFQVFNTQAAQNAVKGKGSDNIAALKLIDPNVVAERHSVIILPKPDESLLRVGDGWNMLKVYSFGLMGPKAYEKIYTINDIEQKGDQRLAVVEMEAIPSTELAEEIENMRQLQDFSDMFDTNEIYTGSLKFDLNSGKIQQYKENLSIEWLVVDPAAKQKDAAEPTAVRMRVVRDYNLERVK